MSPRISSLAPVVAGAAGRGAGRSLRRWAPQLRDARAYYHAVDGGLVSVGMGMTKEEWARVEQLAADRPAGTSLAVAAVDPRGNLWSLNGARVFPAASTIKVAILVALARALDDDRLALTTRLPVRPEHVVAGSGVLLGMQPGLDLPVADHAYLMIAVSDNTASNVLIDSLGLPAIQAAIADLGLTTLALNRRFLGRLPGPGEPENFASADDLARLFAAIKRDRAASPATCAWMRGLLAKQQHRDRLARCLLAGVAFAGKSGSVGPYEHDAALLTGPRGTLAAAVLTAEFPDGYAADAVIGAIGRALAVTVA